MAHQSGVGLCSLEKVMNGGLSATFDAGDPIAHGVDASLGGVDLDNNFKSTLTTSKFFLPVCAFGFTKSNDIFFGVFTS